MHHPPAAGEFLCLIPFAATVWSDQRAAAKSGRPRGFHGESANHKLRTLLSFLVPTLCDAFATTLLNIGLFYTCAAAAPAMSPGLLPKEAAY